MESELEADKKAGHLVDTMVVIDELAIFLSHEDDSPSDCGCVIAEVLFGSFDDITS